MYEVEEWFDLQDFPLYLISTTGFIQNRRTGRILKGGYTDDGYLQVTLRRDGVNHQRYVHVLVAEAFHPCPGPRYEVNHKSGDKTDNGKLNLEWLTHRENMRHAHAMRLISTKAVRIIETGEVFMSATECAAYLGVHKTYVTNHLNGRYPTCKGFHLARV